MTEYRLADLAATSGVTARNIRAYRDRGLIAAPRRVGRASVYDDSHLGQLLLVQRLLHRGYALTHVAEFLAALSQGRGLAEALGVTDLLGIADLHGVDRHTYDRTVEDIRRAVDQLDIQSEADAIVAALDRPPTELRRLVRTAVIAVRDRAASAAIAAMPTPN